jgi:hypothetical protein
VRLYVPCSPTGFESDVLRVIQTYRTKLLLPRSVDPTLFDFTVNIFVFIYRALEDLGSNKAFERPGGVLVNILFGMADLGPPLSIHRDGEKAGASKDAFLLLFVLINHTDYKR